MRILIEAGFFLSFGDERLEEMKKEIDDSCWPAASSLALFLLLFSKLKNKRKCFIMKLIHQDSICIPFPPCILVPILLEALNIDRL